ncbi:hypothetical protein MJO28_009398 [Puccinia striiformis f. sp. tritici]|uniref:Methyltransferase type 11 domain-containing protein n=3 Tax=Puccinia striiformis TaxID=27350 RepID=A0A0L0VWS6_9BASI|nr:hypothetical protein Pst134EB_018629 [Puccinia striiformis f. sp. tritici]KAI7947490.1 hypothetical protein MJO28_009398 [Puccinia striiformis f. sp. tritici]KAI7950251.1 hypothetical protein MJO29_008925 [Puccinia striiformis f. sp. tritici]KNF03769.1 hypothetical protein PSTG_02863 [Puccinia striiformis f. sp. tritici PST-78]POV98219.1 hypothetical protein PSTT_14544 [Puccinia striiformis]
MVHVDCLSLPFCANLNFDFAISIATLHHLSTPERRLQAVRLILSSIKPSHPSHTGRVLIFFWAHKQGEKSRQKWAQGTLLPAVELLKSADGAAFLTNTEDGELH